jgi:hypothetical protein
MTGYIPTQLFASLRALIAGSAKMPGRADERFASEKSE